MIGRNTIPIILAIGVGLLASAGAIYILSEGGFSPFESKQEAPAGPTASPQPGASPPATAALPFASAFAEAEAGGPPRRIFTRRADRRADLRRGRDRSERRGVIAAAPRRLAGQRAKRRDEWPRATADDQGEERGLGKAACGGRSCAVAYDHLARRYARSHLAGARALKWGRQRSPARPTLRRLPRPRKPRRRRRLRRRQSSRRPPRLPLLRKPGLRRRRSSGVPRRQRKRLPSTWPSRARFAASRRQRRAAEARLHDGRLQRQGRRSRQRGDHGPERSGRDDQGLFGRGAARHGARRSRRTLEHGRGQDAVHRQHSFRAERIDTTTGAPARASVAIERLVPKPPEIAAKETKETVTAAAPRQRRGHVQDQGRLYRSPGRYVMGDRQALLRQRPALSHDFPGQPRNHQRSQPDPPPTAGESAPD